MSSRARASFSPPAVLPAQAPVIIRTMRMALEKLGQRSKSVVAKPVVEMMLATWKAAWCRAWPTVA